MQSLSRSGSHLSAAPPFYGISTPGSQFSILKMVVFINTKLKSLMKLFKRKSKYSSVCSLSFEEATQFWRKVQVPSASLLLHAASFYLTTLFIVYHCGVCGGSLVRVFRTSALGHCAFGSALSRWFWRSQSSRCEMGNSVTRQGVPVCRGALTVCQTSISAYAAVGLYRWGIYIRFVISQDLFLKMFWFQSGF